MKIFISYRRSDTQMTAGRLHDALIRHFGLAGVFRDKEDIRPGHDWFEEIQRVLSEDVVVLALIGPQWADSRDVQGRRRLDDPEDSNRLELEAALAKNVPLIPVLVEGADIPGADKLPASLRSLTRRNAIRLRDDDWDADLSRLADAAGSLGVRRLDAVAEDSPRQKANRTAVVRLVASGLLGASLIGAAFWATRPGIDSPSPGATRRPSFTPMQLAGEWAVTQSNSNGSMYQGTLSLRLGNSPLAGSLAWSGLPTAQVTETRVTDEHVEIKVQYPNGVAGTYTASIDGSGMALNNGLAVGGGATATWNGVRPTPATKARTTANALEQLLGEWAVTQHNVDRSMYQGTLSLRLSNSPLVGSLAWSGLPTAQVTETRVTDEQVEIKVQYPGGVAGTYTASIDGSGRALNDGLAVGGGATATWKALRQTTSDGR